MGIPLNYDNKWSGPNISSTLVIWQGGEIPCIELCRFDNIDTVIIKLSDVICKLNDYLDTSRYDLSCFFDNDCPPDFPSLFQFIINQLCKLSEQLEGEGDEDDLCNIKVPLGNLSYTDQLGNNITQLSLWCDGQWNTILYILSLLYQHQQSITNINTSISNINSSINSIWNSISNLSSGGGFPPLGTINCNLFDTCNSTNTGIRAACVITTLANYLCEIGNFFYLNSGRTDLSDIYDSLSAIITYQQSNFTLLCDNSFSLGSVVDLYNILNNFNLILNEIVTYINDNLCDISEYDCDFCNNVSNIYFNNVGLTLEDSNLILDTSITVAGGVSGVQLQDGTVNLYGLTTSCTASHLGSYQMQLAGGTLVLSTTITGGYAQYFLIASGTFTNQDGTQCCNYTLPMLLNNTLDSCIVLKSSFNMIEEYIIEE